MTARLAMLIAAIGLCRPTLSSARKATYATMIDAASARMKIDPLIVIALIDHESGWRERAVSKDGKDFGLGQIRAAFVPKAERKKLLQGIFNLGKALGAIEAWRSLCRTKTDSTIAWLEGYAGRSRPKAVTGAQWCGISVTTGAALPPLKSTVWILARRDRLALSFASSAKGPP